MSTIIDEILADVCLDSRIPDGIFRMTEESHMDALRDQLIKRGISRDIVTEITNRMLEGNFPDRQAWRVEDNRCVTWANAREKALALQKHPGKYTDTEPPKPKPSPSRRRRSRQSPSEMPAKEPLSNEPMEKEPDGEGQPERGVNIFPQADTVQQGGRELEIEPPHSMETPEPAPKSILPSQPVKKEVSKTPQRIAAEKAVAYQILTGDDHSMNKIDPAINEICQYQLNELYKKASDLGFKEAVTFLTPFIKL